VDAAAAMQRSLGDRLDAAASALVGHRETVAASLTGLLGLTKAPEAPEAPVAQAVPAPVVAPIESTPAAPVTPTNSTLAATPPAHDEFVAVVFEEPNPSE